MKTATSARPRANQSMPIVLLAACTVGSMLIGPQLGAGIVAADLAIAAMILGGFAFMAQRGSVARQMLVSSAPWLWLIVVGSFTGLMGVGITMWALDNLARDAFSLAILFATFQLGSTSTKVLRRTLDVVVICTGLLALLIVMTADVYRPGGTFANPNYAAHFLAMGAALLCVTRHRSLRLRSVILLVSSGAIVRTGSFGALVMLLVAALLYVMARAREPRSHGARLLVVIILILLASTGRQAYRTVEDPAFQAGTSISAYRLQNTSNVRQQLWSAALEAVPENPLGVGPAGIKNRELLPRGIEVHNDLLGYLLERGVIGLAGLVGFLLVLARYGRRGGGTRLLIALVLVGGLFRETLHFRHMWIFVGLALAHDVHLRRKVPPDARPAVERRGVKVGR
ncbi:MAG TPA: O-antigen ligase family protein [Acidimicrobiales bacterium]|nr:O-antigen ligase family protein [Acidimicrobiales bacterium]